MSPVITPSIKFTYHDYLNMTDDVRREIIDGEFLVVPAPAIAHQDFLWFLVKAFSLYFDQNPIGKAILSPVDVVLSEHDVVQPDMIVVLNENRDILTPQNCQGAPDVCIEILSPSNRIVDTEIKHKLYAKFGVKEYWIVDLEARCMERYELGAEGYGPATRFSRNEAFTSPLLPEFTIDLREAFARIDSSHS